MSVMTTRVLEVRKNVLNKNDELARTLRQEFQSAGVFVLNLVSSPGTGKTMLLEKTLAELRRRRQVEPAEFAHRVAERMR